MIHKNIGTAFDMIRSGFETPNRIYERIVEETTTGEYEGDFPFVISYKNFVKNTQELLSDPSFLTGNNSKYNVLEMLLEEPFEEYDIVKDEYGQPVCGKGPFIGHNNFDSTFEFLNDLKESIRNGWHNVQYIGPLRHTPERFYQKNFNFKDSVGIKGEHLAEMIYADEARKASLNRWLTQLGIEYKADVCKLSVSDPDIDLYVMKLTDKYDINVSPADVGFGVSQIMPIITQTVSSKNRLILIEQPEIHLHPKLQAEMADLFISSAKGPDKNTFVLETHSEHLLLRIMRRMRETATGKLEHPEYALTPDDVSVLYVESIDGRSIVREMPLNEYGELVVPWPGGFFEEGLREMF